MESPALPTQRTSSLVERLAALLQHPDRAVALQGAELLHGVSPAEAAAALLQGADASRGGLRNLPLDGLDLRGQPLQGIRLKNCTLRGTDLRGADLSGAQLSDLELGETRLDGVNLSGARCDDCTGGDLRTATIKKLRVVGDANGTRWGDRPPRFLPGMRCVTCGALQGSPLRGIAGVTYRDVRRDIRNRQRCWDQETRAELAEEHPGRWRLHHLVRGGARVHCLVCKGSWTRPPAGMESVWCPGIRLYRGWEAVPEMLTTKTMAKKKHGIPRRVLDALPPIPHAWVDTCGGVHRRHKLWRLDDLRDAAGVRAVAVLECAPAPEPTPERAPSASRQASPLAQLSLF